MAESETENRPRQPRITRRLVLEILAIFLGISASFWVEDWREERQDTETFHRILGEVYYNVILDDFSLIGLAAANNLALAYASDLVIREAPLPPPDELFRQIETIFSRSDWEISRGGYDRLTNTPLAIPVNDIQLALDNLYGALQATRDASRMLNENLQRIGVAHWWVRGVIPCGSSQLNISAQPDRIERMGLQGQLAPAIAAVRSDAGCLTEGFNHAAAVEAMESEEFRTALRTVINIRQSVAGNLLSARLFADFIRENLVNYQPDIGLPVESLHILGTATEVGWEPGKAIPLEREGPNEWVLDLTLGKGTVKFLANREWTINWGAQPPWIASSAAGDDAFQASNIDREAVFPVSRGFLNGVNIPVIPGRYRIRFSTQSFEYSFEALD